MNIKYAGDFLGELDENGIAQYYPNCKVRKEGDLYFATPHTTNNTPRRKRREETITVCERDGKLSIVERPAKAENKPVEPVQISFDEVLAERDKSPPKQADEPKSRTVTRKQLFDELYAKYDKLKPHLRKQAILEEMLPLFKNEQAAKLFVDENWSRHRRNNYVKKKRFQYKAMNQEYQYFVTFTYSDEKHTEETFVKCLKDTFANFHKRKGWLIQGIWERGDETDRLHFHGLIYDPNNKIADDLEQVTDYNPKTGKVKTYKRHKYFFERFGRNEFSELIPQMYESAIDYITKYISKHGVRPYYSRGLYTFFKCDIMGTDVIGKMNKIDERDNRLIVADKFMCLDEGVVMGEASPEVIARLPKAQ